MTCINKINIFDNQKYELEFILMLVSKSLDQVSFRNYEKILYENSLPPKF